MKYFLVMDLVTNEIKIARTTDKISEITGWAESSFSLMQPNDVYYIGHYSVRCVSNEVVVYYNNLWKFEEE